MHFELKRTPTESDIAIGIVRTVHVESSDVVQLIDMSDSIESNSIAAVPYILTSLGSTTTMRLEARNTCGDIELTDEFSIDKTTGTMYPLWYVHNVRHVYFNPSASKRKIIRRIRTGRLEEDRIVKNLVASDKARTIVVGSETVKRISPSGGTYAVDVNHAIGTAYIYGRNGSEVSEGQTFEIEYWTVPVDVVIEGDDPLARPEVSFAYDDNNSYFSLRILSTQRKPMRVRYTSVDENGEVRPRTETTIVSPLFSKTSLDVVTQTVDVDFAASRYFCIEWVNSACYIRVPPIRDYPKRKYAFRAATYEKSIIRLCKPSERRFVGEWYPEVSAGRIVTRSGIVFEIKQRPFVDTVDLVREDVKADDGRTIVLGKKDVIVYVGVSGEIEGVNIINASGNVMETEAIDPENGVVVLKGDSSSDEDLTAVYSVRKRSVPIPGLCINPLHKDHNNGMPYRAIAFFMVPSNDGESKLPVYARPLPLYHSGEFIMYSAEYLDAIANRSEHSTRITFRNGIIGLPREYIENLEKRIEVLGVMYETNPVDEDGYDLIDARIYGGGTEEYNRSYFDYSFYDGEGIDLDCYVRIHVPRTVYEDLVDRLYRWDVEVCKTEDEIARKQKAMSRARQILEEKAKKFTMIGSVREVIIE